MPIPPVTKTVNIPLPPDRAFRLFTEGLGSWWPIRSHSVTQDPTARVEVTPGPGGTITEIGPDGARYPWARITAWEEGHRLAMDWFPGQQFDEATQVVVTFTRDGTGTRLDLVHGGWEARGPAATMVADNYRRGWDLVLAAFAAVLPVRA